MVINNQEFTFEKMKMSPHWNKPLSVAEMKVELDKGVQIGNTVINSSTSFLQSRQRPETIALITAVQKAQALRDELDNQLPTTMYGPASTRNPGLMHEKFLRCLYDITESGLSPDLVAEVSDKAASSNSIRWLPIVGLLGVGGYLLTRK
jgi:hypothetical protein